MNVQQAEDRLHSLQHFAILILLWGGAMLWLAVIIAEPGSLITRVGQDVLLSGGAITLIVVGVTLGISAQLGLRRSHKGLRVLSLAVVPVLIFAVVALVDFVSTTARGSSPAVTAIAAVSGLVVVVLGSVLLWRVTMPIRDAMLVLMRN